MVWTCNHLATSRLGAQLQRHHAVQCNQCANISDSTFCLGPGRLGIASQLLYSNPGVSDGLCCELQLANYVHELWATNYIPLPGEVDIIMGGPPCQGVSGLNRHSKTKEILDDPRQARWLTHVRHTLCRKMLLKMQVMSTRSMTLQPAFQDWDLLWASERAYEVTQRQAALARCTAEPFQAHAGTGRCWPSTRLLSGSTPPTC